MYEKNRKLIYGLLTTFGFSTLWNQGTSIGRNLNFCENYLSCQVSLFAWIGLIILGVFTLIFFVKFIKELNKEE